MHLLKIQDAEHKIEGTFSVCLIEFAPLCSETLQLFFLSNLCLFYILILVLVLDSNYPSLFDIQIRDMMPVIEIEVN